MARKLDNATALYMEGIRDGHARRAVEAYTGDRYTQHSTGVRDGVEGFVEFFTGFLERNPVREIRIVRGWEDGRHVFVQAYQSLNHGEYEYLTTDFFDTDDDDKIIEHWDVIRELPGPTPSGRTAIDGPTEITDLDQTDANKALVCAMLRHCLFDGADAQDIGDFIAEPYIQHSAGVADGLAAFAALAQRPDRPLNYQEIVLCVGQGNFVATLCRATLTDRDVTTPLCQADIFRVQDGRIVEHWDNAEPVPTESVNSGKF